MSLTGLILFELHFLSSSMAVEQTATSSPSPTNETKFTSKKTVPKSFPVVLDEQPLFSFASNIPGLPAKSRAERTSRRIEKIAKDTNIDTSKLNIFSLEGVRIISTDEEMIVSLIEADAKAANLSLDQLSQNYLNKVKEGITQYREKRKISQLVWRIIRTTIATIIVITLLKFLNVLFPKIYNRINENRAILFRPLRIQNWQILSADQEANFLGSVLKILRLILVVLILYLYIPLVLSFFPFTEHFGTLILSSFYSALQFGWSAFLKYLPNVFIILLVAFITYYTICLFRTIFRSLENGTVNIPGFYQDWAQPTYKLTVFLILALAAIIIFPYLPGFGSAAFQGVSLLLGALVTFGGASTISNLFGGFVTIYTRAFQLGDRITISDYTGVVIEKTILSTRIRTPNNEIVTIPNSTMVASSITNYSASLRDIKEPLILHTTVTLGYDLPWRFVHETLISAALITTDILAEPSPCVWQTSLDDFYVSYEIRAYTNKPIKIKEIYSELHQNVQDKCNEVGIEIMSPHYSALRDGNQSTIPANYLDSDYLTPGFRIQPLTPTQPPLD